LSDSVLARSSLRASREISSLRSDAMFGMEEIVPTY
jgi:hypothetical protein